MNRGSDSRFYGRGLEVNLEALRRHEQRAVGLLILAFWLITRIMTLVRVWVIEGVAANNDYGFIEFLQIQAVGLIPFFGIFYGLYLALQALRRRPMALQIAAAAMLSLVGLLAISLVQFAAVNIVGIGGRVAAFSFSLKYTANYSWAYLPFYTAAILALTYHYDLRLRDRQAFNLEIEAREERLRALRYQVDPHFLFNALNSISVLLLDQRVPDAEKMVMWLANFFRSSIALSPLCDVPLRDELELQRLYIDLERVRFEDRLELMINVPIELEMARVPNLILQPLVENAVKHGIGGSGSTTRVTISASAHNETLIIRVEDNGRSTSTRAGTGTGLRNVSDRLTSLYGSAARLQHGPRAEQGYSVTMEFPLKLDSQPPESTRVLST